jgi:hypothetical protein
MTKRIAYLASVAFCAVSAPSVQAAYVVSFQEEGSDVVESGMDSLDLTDRRRRAQGQM